MFLLFVEERIMMMQYLSFQEWNLSFQSNLNLMKFVLFGKEYKLGSDPKSLCGQITSIQ